MEVINQNNINEVIQSQIKFTEKTIESVALSTAKMSKSIKLLETGGTKLSNVEKHITTYTNIASTIINTFCKSMPDGKSLDDLLGRIEEQSETQDEENGKKTIKKDKTVKYTVVESIDQLSTIIGYSTDMIKKISEMELGFKAMLKTKKNIIIMKHLLSEVIVEFLNSLYSISNMDGIDKILECLVKQPDTTITEIENNITKGETQTVDASKTKTIVQGGKLGILDVINQTVNLMGMLANMKLPNMLLLQLRLVKMKLSLERVVDTLIEFAMNYASEDKLKEITNLAILIAGDPNSDGANKGLVNLVNKIVFLFNTVKTFSFTKKEAKNVNIALNNLKSVIENLLEFLATKGFETLSKAEYGKLLLTIKNNVQYIAEIFQSLSSIAKYSVIIKLLGWAITGAMNRLVSFIESLEKLKDKKIDSGIQDVLGNIIDVIKTIRNIMLNLAVMIPLALVGMAGIVVSTLFLLALGMFVWVLGLFFSFVRKPLRWARVGIRRITNVFMALMMVGVAILLLAVVTPVITKALTGHVMPFILLLVGCIALLFVISWISRKLIVRTRKNIFNIALNVLIIAGLFLVMGLSLLVMGWIGSLLTWEMWGYIIMTLVGIAIVGALIWAVSKVLNKASQDLMVASKSLFIVVAVLGLLVAAGLTLVILGWIGKQIADTETILYIGFGIAAVLAAIQGCVIIGKALGKAAANLTQTAVTFVPLLVVMGLLIAAGLTLLILGWIGKQIADGDTIANIVIAVVATTIFATVLVGLGMALSFAAPFLTVTTAVIVPLLIVAGLLVASGLLLIVMGHIGKQMEEQETALYAGKLVGYIASVGLKIGLLGLEMMFIGPMCLLLVVMILPLMAALTMISSLAKNLVELSKSADEIDIEKVKKSMDNIKEYWEAFKEFADSFSWKDILFMQLKSTLISSLIGNTVNVIFNIVDVLNSVQNVQLDTTSITDVVEKVFNFVNTLQTKINEILADDDGSGNIFQRVRKLIAAKRRERELKRRLGRVTKIVNQVYAIANELTSIQNVKLDTAKIEGNVNYIFSFIGKLEELIKLNLENTTAFEDNVVWVWKRKWYGGYWEQERRENTNVEKLNKVDKVVSGIKNIAETLKMIQQITINESKIETNVKYIFDFIDKLAKILETRLASVTAFDDDVTWVWVKGGWFSRGYWKEERTENASAKKLDKVQQVMSSIATIIDGIKSLSEVEITDKLKSTVSNNIDRMFEFINQISERVNTLFNSTDINKKTTDYLNSEDFDKNTEKFGNFGNVLKTLKEMTDSIKQVEKFKIGPEGKKRIEDSISTIFNASSFIVRKVNEGLAEQSNAQYVYDQLNPFIDALSKLNEGFESLSKVDNKAFKKNVKDFAEFMSRVNKVDIVKVEKTTNLFEKMSQLTKEMDGNFDKIAIALTEKLLPVLEDLKTIMVDVPEKLDKGFSNTSASIAATNAAPTKSGYEAQVRRENPSWDNSQVNQEAEARLNDKAKADANGIAAKLDELIALFKGHSSEVAIVRQI